MDIKQINDYTPFMKLLLLADPSLELVEAYVRAGHVVGATIDGAPVGVYVLVNNGQNADGAYVWELKNIAVAPTHHRTGIGHRLLAHAEGEAKALGASIIEVGTGDAGVGQLAFYENAGFCRDRVDEGFFLRNYDEPIIENGLQHKDMIFLTKHLGETK